jgi:hypothetical protein
LIICGVFIFACKPDEPEVDPKTENPIDPLVVAALDHISDRLRFSGSTKIQGNSPAAPAASSLKFSLKDTLYLVPGIKMPIKFLHMGATQNVAGVYVQVYNANTGAHFHFDVPEAKKVGSDSTSVVLVGFDDESTGLAPFGGGATPASWVGAEDDVEIEITPYDESGLPIDEVTVPVVVVEENNEADTATPDLCGVINEGGGWWEWNFSLIVDESAANENDSYGPESVLKFSTSAKGCCENGISEYSELCLGTPFERTLSFNFFTQQAYESIHFHNNGNYARVTEMRRNNPDIENSDFCNDSGKGAVTPTRITAVTHRGDWKITKGTVPSNSKSKIYPPGTPVDMLTTFTKSLSPSEFTGFSSVEGIIRQVTCDFLLLVKLDNEGGDQTILNLYVRRQPNDEYWHAM